MPQSKYIQFTENGKTYILSKDPPFYIGHIIYFESNEKLEDWVARKMAEKGYCVCGRVQGYNILVAYAGSLQKADMPDNSKDYRDMAADLQVKVESTARLARYKRKEKAPSPFKTN